MKKKISDEFTRVDIRKRKIIELRKIRQNNGKSIEEYIRRFKNILRIVTREHVLHETYQVDFYIEELKPVLGYNVRRRSLINMTNAVKYAREEEEAKDAT